MVTAYDFPSAQVAEEAGVDVVLVGDTAAMVVLGYDATTPVGDGRDGDDGGRRAAWAEDAAADRRPALRLLRARPTSTRSRTRQRFVREAGCDAVKLERGGASVDRARASSRAGIPVMGHVGLTPQTATALGGFRPRGRTAESAAQIAGDAFALQAAGCFAIVFEAVPAEVTEALMPRIECR